MSTRQKYLLLITIFTILYFHCDITIPSNDIEFGIYLLQDTSLTTSDAKDKKLESIKLQDYQIMNLNDIIRYNWDKHLITLTTEARGRFENLDKTVKSIDGLPFVFVAKEDKIYLGNIYPLFSSYIHMDLPYFRAAPFKELKIIRAPSEYIEDKRNDDRILSVLQEHEKL